MHFPETDCEKQILQQLGLPIAEAIPFGIMQYIQIACRAGFYPQEIATSAARLLRWSSILEKIKKRYPNLVVSEAIESDLKGAYLKYGSGLKFLELVAEFLNGSQRYEKEAKFLKAKQTKEERKGRRQVWEEMITTVPTVRSLPFMEELEIDIELFDMPISDAQKELTTKAAEEKNLLKKMPHAYWSS